jgi:hypothetical protein
VDEHGTWVEQVEGSMINDTGLRVGPSEPATRGLCRAWVALALLPVAFVVAMIVGEGLITMLGYESGAEDPLPVGPALLASILALLILIAPGIAAVFYGRCACRVGRRDANVPAWIGGLAVVLVVALNVPAFLVGR